MSRLTTPSETTEPNVGDDLPLQPLDQQLALALERAGDLQSRNTLSSRAILAIANALERHIPDRGGHGRRVGRYARALAKASGMSANDTRIVEWGGILHDLGKIALPAFVLLKPSALTPAEWTQIRLHPETGATLLTNASLDERLATLVRHHHERFDGSGYPGGLTRFQIPLGARIIAIVDTFDAITSGRPYRPPRSAAAAIQELLDRAGTQFDPELVARFVALWRNGDIARLRGR